MMSVVIGDQPKVGISYRRIADDEVTASDPQIPAERTVASIGWRIRHFLADREVDSGQVGTGEEVYEDPADRSDPFGAEERELPDAMKGAGPPLLAAVTLA